MQILDFELAYLSQAEGLARQNYEEERQVVAALPKVRVFPSLREYAENGLGVAAVEKGRLLGFLGCSPPWEAPWGIPGIRAVFSPLQAHGAVVEGRERLYSLLYQKAAEKWVQAGAVSHAVAVYAHDQAANDSFFWNGFGMRCVDAIRPLTPIPLQEAGFLCMELFREELPLLLPLVNGLCAYEKESPYFLFKSPQTEETLLQEAAEEGCRYFAAKFDKGYAAYLKLSWVGESFAAGERCVQNICGAFCLPEYRGKGLYANLLSHVTEVLRREGYTHLGVDYESFNPAGRGFWHKHFTDYTHGLVRRVDETVLL